MGVQGKGNVDNLEVVDRGEYNDLALEIGEVLGCKSEARCQGARSGEDCSEERKDRKERFVALTGIVPLHIVFPLR